MTGGRTHPSPHGWSQQRLLAPTLSRVCMVVHLDGPGGDATWSYLVTHGVSRDWISCEVLHGRPLRLAGHEAAERLEQLVRSEINGLSPF